jgi:hypothetical protein
MSTFMFKVMNLVVRTIAKPLISWVTHYKKLKFKEESGSKLQIYLRKKLISVGQSWNYYNIIINRKLFKISSGHTSVSSLSEEKALERGAEVISEVLIYSLLILIPLLEWWRLSKISKAKEKVKEDFLNETKILTQMVLADAKEINQEINEIKYLMEEIEKKIDFSSLNNKL